MSPRDPRQAAATRLFSTIMIVVGVAMLVRTLAAGGGAAALGVVLGALFVLAGAGRLYLTRKAGAPPEP
jgi:hypothetical protein